jgi:hypothetical protein
VKGDASRVPGQQPEPQSAADHQVMLGLRAKADVVEGIAQPAREVCSLPIALGANLGEPRDGLCQPCVALRSPERAYNDCVQAPGTVPR